MNPSDENILEWSRMEYERLKDRSKAARDFAEKESCKPDWGKDPIGLRRFLPSCLREKVEPINDPFMDWP